MACCTKSYWTEGEYHDDWCPTRQENRGDGT